MISLATPPTADLPHEPLVACLRAEIEEYGGLVALFEDQQAAILARDADQIVALAKQLERQVLASTSRRKEREVMVAQMLPGEKGAPPATIAEVVPRLREPVRPLVEALKDEINRLIAHTRRRAHQNQMLLARTVETSQELSRRLDPQASAHTSSSPRRMKGRTASRTRRLLSRS